MSRIGVIKLFRICTSIINHYDKKTNTLTLNGYQEAEKRIVANEMGDDFKVKVVGNNQIQGIAVWGYSYGGSLTLEGNGSLEINKNRVQGEPISLMAEEANAQFKVKQGVTLKVYRDNKFPSYTASAFSTPMYPPLFFWSFLSLWSQTRWTRPPPSAWIF